MLLSVRSTVSAVGHTRSCPQAASSTDLIAMKGGGKGKKAREARSRRLKRPTYGEKGRP